MERDTKSFPKLRLQVQNESLIFISDKLIFSCEKTTRIPTTQPLLYTYPYLGALLFAVKSL